MNIKLPKDATLVEAPENTSFTVVITFSDNLETEFQGVSKFYILPNGGYWLIQEDGTWNDVRPGYHFAAISTVEKA